MTLAVVRRPVRHIRRQDEACVVCFLHSQGGPEITQRLRCQEAQQFESPKSILKVVTCCLLGA